MHHNALKQPKVDRHLHCLQVLLICFLLKMNECCHEYSTQILVNPCKYGCYLNSPTVALLLMLSLCLGDCCALLYHCLYQSPKHKRDCPYVLHHQPRYHHMTEIKR